MYLSDMKGDTTAFGKVPGRCREDGREDAGKMAGKVPGYLTQPFEISTMCTPHPGGRADSLHMEM